jgi:hypothetical protein
MADVFMAAITAAEVAAKLIKPGNSNGQVTEAMGKVAEAYGVNAMQGTLMHQMKRCVPACLPACLRVLHVVSCMGMGMCIYLSACICVCYLHV